MLTSFEIKNFRTFKHLTIPTLSQVNLIVGKNNTGKTTLLEALRCYATGGGIALNEYLVDHDEFDERLSYAYERPFVELRALFHERLAEDREIVLGPTDDSNNSLKLSADTWEMVPDSRGDVDFTQRPPGEPLEGELVTCVVSEVQGQKVLQTPRVILRRSNRGRYEGPPHVPAGGVNSSDLVQWWDDVVLTAGEKRVTQYVSAVTSIDGIVAVANPSRETGRLFEVRLADSGEKVPLKRLGAGSYRVFEIAVAIEYACQTKDKPDRTLHDRNNGERRMKKGLVLIDEIDSGLHHSVMEDLWRFVFKAANDHDIQVFATTHSWDCVRGFGQAVEEGGHDGRVIRLERAGDTSAVVDIDPNDLRVVVREEFEIR